MHCSKVTRIFKKDAVEFATISPPTPRHALFKVTPIFKKDAKNSPKICPNLPHALYKSYANFFIKMREISQKISPHPQIMHCSKASSIFENDSGEFAETNRPPVMHCLKATSKTIPVNSQKLTAPPRHALFKSYTITNPVFCVERLRRNNL